jgi:hypothetical protein
MFMKKVHFFILGLTVLGFMAFGMTGNTGAWFTSYRELTDNTITSGTLDLGVEGTSFSAIKLQPGADWSGIGWFCVTNNGDYDMKWRGWLYDVVDPKGLQPFLDLRVILNPVSHQGNYGALNSVGDTYAFGDLVSETNTILLVDETDTPFEPQSNVCHELQARLSSSAGNAQQDGTLTAKMNLFGTQWNAPWQNEE